MSNEKLKFDYKLTYDESYEAFYLLACKWSRKVRILIVTALALLTVILMALYYFDSQRVYYFYLVILMVLMLFYIIYTPIYKARKGAKQVARTNGLYSLTVTKDGHIILPDQDEPLKISNDKNARTFETETSFILRPDGNHTFCLPKRIMKPEDADTLRVILEDHSTYIRINEHGKEL